MSPGLLGGQRQPRRLALRFSASSTEGYPQDNIIFEDSQTAVLIQNRQEAMRADMSRPGELPPSRGRGRLSPL